MSWVRIPPTSYFRFFREQKKGNNVFANVRAGDVMNGDDNLLLSTTVVRVEGRAPVEVTYPADLLSRRFRGGKCYKAYLG